MSKPSTLKRLALAFGIGGVVLMGIDLLITRNFFTHVAELMASSIACFVIALILDHKAGGKKSSE